MITLYGVARSRASRNIWLMKELGLDFTMKPVIQVYRLPAPNASDAPMHTQSPEFLAVNPNGQIPTLDDSGYVINESLAINLYLARKYGGDLAPRDVGEEGHMIMWSLWAATSCEGHAIQILYNRGGKPPEESDEALAVASVAALRAPFRALDQALARNGYLVGGRFTVADINVAEIMRYAQPAPELFATAPNVKAWIERCQARPAFKEMAAMRAAEPA